jgi:hypothetical protein
MRNMPTVIILLSDKRSGSTMFQNEICKHPDIQTVIYSPHTYLETHHWLKGAVLLGKSDYSGYGLKKTFLILLYHRTIKNLYFKVGTRCAANLLNLYFLKNPHNCWVI